MKTSTSLRLRPVHRLMIALLALVTALPFAAFAGGQANAAPRGGTVNATVTNTGTSALVKIASGSLNIENGALVVRNNAGAVLEKVDLSYVGADNRTYPVDAAVHGRSATLTPSKDASRSTATPASVLKGIKANDAAAKRRRPQICGPQTRKQRDNEALSQLSTELGIAISLGALVGGVIGAIITIAGGGLGAPIGIIVGAAVGLGGAAIAGTFTRYFQTINSPFKPKYC